MIVIYHQFSKLNRAANQFTQILMMVIIAQVKDLRKIMLMPHVAQEFGVRPKIEVGPAPITEEAKTPDLHVRSQVREDRQQHHERMQTPRPIRNRDAEQGHGLTPASDHFASSDHQSYAGGPCLFPFQAETQEPDSRKNSPSSEPQHRGVRWYENSTTIATSAAKLFDLMDQSSEGHLSIYSIVQALHLHPDLAHDLGFAHSEGSDQSLDSLFRSLEHLEFSNTQSITLAEFVHRVFSEAQEQTNNKGWSLSPAFPPQQQLNTELSSESLSEDEEEGSKGKEEVLDEDWWCSNHNGDSRAPQTGSESKGIDAMISLQLSQVSICGVPLIKEAWINNERAIDGNDLLGDPYTNHISASAEGQVLPTDIQTNSPSKASPKAKSLDASQLPYQQILEQVYEQKSKVVSPQQNRFGFAPEDYAEPGFAMNTTGTTQRELSSSMCLH